jgi:hypothetical protein
LGNLLHVEVTKNGFRILFQQIESKDYLENREVCDQFRKIIRHLQGRWVDGLNLINLALDRDQWWALVNARSGSTQSGEHLNKRSCNTRTVWNKYAVEVLLICTACPIHGKRIHIIILVIGENRSRSILFNDVINC